MKKILLADGNDHLIEKIKNASGSEHYEFAICQKGDEVLGVIHDFSPDLIYLDLLLPQMHGIELLKEIRKAPNLERVGVILASTNSMIQNFHAALQEGVDFFLKKPFEIPYLYILFNRFFEGTLQPEQSEGPKEETQKGAYLPKAHQADSYLHFWGTRGSNPVSGPEFTRFGGNTACLEVRSAQDLVIIDAGTGIRPLGQTLDPSIETIHIFLSHTHWDHITGFPFFEPIYNPNAHIVIWSPVGFEKSTRELFTEMLAYAFFPVRLEDIKARLSFNDLRTGHCVSIGNIKIDSHYAFHPGSTVCFKIHIKDKTIGYATDNELFLGYLGDPNALLTDTEQIQNHQSMIDFFTGCDTLIHEAQFTPLEYQKRVGWGHSSISNAAILCKKAKITDWILTHHDPNHTDSFLLEKLRLQEQILKECAVPCRTQMAFDGMHLGL